MMAEIEVRETSFKKRGPSRSAVHLWEFLLELLADDRFSSLIMWTRKEHGEFKLRNQEEVAKRWGKLKQRPGMNYDKLSRALRYYYQKNIIKKVSGQRLVYKFVDLPYSYEPIKNLYETNLWECEERGGGGLEPKRDDQRRGLLHAFSCPNFITTTSSPDFRVVQEPIASQRAGQVALVTNGCYCPVVSRATRHISVPVIMKCGHPSDLPCCNSYESVAVKSTASA